MKKAVPFILAPLSLALGASFFPAFANTETNVEIETEIDEVIVVTATRTQRSWNETPAAVDRVEIDEQFPGQRTDAAELLQGIPGIQTDTRYNFAQDTRIILRGFGARAAFGVRGVVLALDGIPLSMPDGQAQTSSILLDEPQRVEVLRGPVAGVYGNAAGGIIAFTSEAPAYSKLSAGISAGAGNRQRYTANLDWRGDQAAGRLFYADFSTDGDRDHAAAERQQWAGRWFYELENGVELIARVDDNDAPLLQDPLALSAEQWRDNPRQTLDRAETFNSRKAIRHQQQSVTVRQLTTEQQWQVSAWNGKRDVVQFLPFPGGDITSSGAVIDLSRYFYGVHAQYSLFPVASEDWKLTFGTDIERQRDERKGFVNDFGQRGDLRRDETGRVESTDFWLISDWAFAERWNWVTGLRYSDIQFSVDDYFIVPPNGGPGNPDDSGATAHQEVSWSAALNYQLSANLSAFASAGEGFETPTLTEMAYRNEGTGLNTELQPAQIRQYEAGLKWQSATLRAQAVAFDIQSDDEIVVDRSIDGRTTYRNAAQTKRRGLEFSANWQFANDWWIRSSATLMNAEYREFELDGNRIPGIARQNLYAQLNWEPLDADRLRLSAYGQYRSNVATTDENTEYAPSYSVFGLAATTNQHIREWSFHQWVRVDNLTDKKYVGSVVVNQGSGRSFEPAPGRQFSAGFEIKRRF